MDDDDEDGPPRLPGGKFYMTPEGHARLQAELADRWAERHRVVEVVAWAAGNGDRSENADYKEGKRRLRFLGRRLAHAEVVDPAAQTRRDQVFFGAIVTYLTGREEEVTVTITQGFKMLFWEATRPAAPDAPRRRPLSPRKGRIPLANSKLAICSRHLASWQHRSAGVADGLPQLLNGRCSGPGEFANGIRPFAGESSSNRSGIRVG